MSYLWDVPHALHGSALGAMGATPLATALNESLLALGLGKAALVTAS